MSSDPASLYSRKNPFPAPHLVNQRLSGPSSQKETRHHEISLAGSGLHYEVGDSLGVFASNEPGLQVLDLEGNWHDVPCDPGSVAINAGDMLDYVTGGYYPSTTHRVNNPTGESAKRSRVSTPLFLHPADDVVISEGKTAFDFLRDRIKEIAGVELTK